MIGLLALLALLARTASPPRAAPSITDPIAEAQSWLVRHQSDDGLWHAGRPDPCRVATIFEVDEALTALALVALEGNEAAREARERGVRALLAAQHADGGFGSPGSAKRRFNWTLATWALARLAPVEEGTRRGLKRVQAEALTRSLDDCEAGWALLAFQEARARGLAVRQEAQLAAWESVHASVEAHRDTTPVIRAMEARFQGATPRDSKTVMMEIPRVAGSDDLHLLFFALPASPVDTPDVVRYLLRTQSASGCARGSWAPDRWWGTAGGRVYATATAVLILREAKTK